MSEARWVTTNSRLLRVAISEHGLDPESTHILGLLVDYIVNVYANAWFSVRCMIKNNLNVFVLNY